MSGWIYGVAAVGAYLLGSIPTGYWVGRSRGVDLRQAGSGNIGASNAMRLLGRPAGTLVLGVDALKGFVACGPWASICAVWIHGDGASGADLEWVRILTGVCAVLGHNYTCWLRFRGGKGIATSAGVLGALMPHALVYAFLAFAILAISTRIISVGSLAAAFVLPFAAWWTGSSRRLIIIAGVLSAMAIFKHRGNVRRLIEGTEPRIGDR